MVSLTPGHGRNASHCIFVSADSIALHYDVPIRETSSREKNGSRDGRIKLSINR